MSQADDKIFISLIAASLVSTAASFYFLRQFIVRDAGIWVAPMFIPIYIYVILIFIINVSLSIIAYKKERFLSLAFTFATISIDIILITALILNVKNPNG